MFLCKLEVLSIWVKANPGEAMDTRISQGQVSHWVYQEEERAWFGGLQGTDWRLRASAQKRKMPGGWIPFN